jgi:phage host-nuclease inhibitor protein Gam
MTKRRKADAIQAPATREEAEALLRQFAAMDAEADRNDRWLAQRIDEAKAVHSEMAAQLKASMRDIFNRLKPWWAVMGPEIAPGRRSVVLEGCVIGHRTGTPELVVPRDREPHELIEELEFLGFAEWALRVKRELDKQALIKALRAPACEADAADAAALRGLGFQVRQTESFFIERVKDVPEPTETLPTPPPAPVAGLEGDAA